MSKVTIGIPAFNQEATIAESIDSALSQVGVDKDVLVIDDCSTDGTTDIIKQYKGRIRMYRSRRNMGIGNTLVSLMNQAEGDYIVYLCGDDVFNGRLVCRYVHSIFKSDAQIGIIDRQYYQFIDGSKKICGRIDEKNIYQSACQPSGMAFRIDRSLDIRPSNDIFIEMPSIVKQYINADYHSFKILAATIFARIHKNNTATKSFYYNGQSPTRNWVSLVGTSFRFPEGFVQMKNRAPQYLLREIWITMTLTPKAMLSWRFWFCAFVAIVTPRPILIKLSWWWRANVLTAIYKWRNK